jgi:co-chaperonin GroES (HSP10)
MKLRPLRDLLIIRPEKTPGMIGALHVPDIGLSGNKSTCICEVVAAGPGFHPKIHDGKKKGRYRERFVPTQSKVGDRVLVEAYGSHPAGDEVECDGEKFTMIRERDIVGILA